MSRLYFKRVREDNSDSIERIFWNINIRGGTVGYIKYMRKKGHFIIDLLTSKSTYKRGQKISSIEQFKRFGPFITPDEAQQYLKDNLHTLLSNYKIITIKSNETHQN